MKARCYNCKHKSQYFKVGKLTHYHCFHPKYEEEGKKGNVSPWETLVVFSDTCDDHEFKQKSN